ncbi:hypothetical protein Vadar_028080 [Vaccinium darrowii]|uniref:Uncharacterized protein n=1 Tax=Vaccinium darrowii TaxID=229202 RepID=A0ACB7X4J8_9ERIC|nr:hypothetical protein Vadar_028080 [Vaccinium darrowii]
MFVSPLISAAQAVLSGLTPLATEQIKGLLNFKEDLETLHRRLNIIQALLSDAENGQGKKRSQVMRVWLKNLMLAACKAENVLDKIAYESLRHKVEVRKRDRDVQAETGPPEETPSRSAL